MSSLVPETGWAQGASGPAEVYDTSPAGLGLSPAYLAPGAHASASAGGGTTGTTFPTSPADGTQFTYIADATSGIEWTFKYRAASASAYKWEFVGGSAAVAAVETSENTASAAYVDLATVGPSFILPLAGDYVVDLGFSAASVAGGAGIYHAQADLFKNAAAQGYAIYVPCQNAGIAGTAERSVRIAAAAASDVLKLKYLSNNASNTAFSGRVLQVVPARVSG